jgi:hypothetical protein
MSIILSIATMSKVNNNNNNNNNNDIDLGTNV